MEKPPIPRLPSFNEFEVAASLHGDTTTDRSEFIGEYTKYLNLIMYRRSIGIDHNGVEATLELAGAHLEVEQVTTNHNQ